MSPSELLELFYTLIPQNYADHMFCYFSHHAAHGRIPPFVFGLNRSLGRIESASPGYAREMLERMAAIQGKGEAQYEGLLQILSEVYVTAGAVEVADEDEFGRPIFRHEPTIHDGKNPEFETRSQGLWYAVEVKTPKLIGHGRVRQSAPYQLTARLPRELTDKMQKVLPRDNPVKDFLVSANEKFDVYSQIRPEAFRILTIVWDDFCNEPIAALLNPNSGLLTSNSFLKGPDGSPVSFPFVDGVLICRYQHQIIRATREEPLIDGEGIPLVYHHEGFPPKALIQNPAGRPIPDGLLGPLNAVRLEDCPGAEYHPTDLVMWAGGESDESEQPDA